MSRRAKGWTPGRCGRCGTEQGARRPGQAMPPRRSLAGLVPGCDLVVCITCYNAIQKRLRTGLPAAVEVFHLAPRPVARANGLPVGVYARSDRVRCRRPYFARAPHPVKPSGALYLGAFATPAAAAAARRAYLEGGRP